MQSASDVPATKPTLSIQTLREPRFILTAWLVGFWLLLALIECYTDAQLTKPPFSQFAINLQIMMTGACLGQLMAIFTLTFFSNRGQWLLNMLVGAMASIATIVIFRVYNPIHFFDIWPFFLASPAVYIFVYLAIRALFKIQQSDSSPSARFQISIADIFLAMFIVAVFFSLLRYSIHDFRHVLIQDVKDCLAFHPEGTGRIMRGFATAIVCLFYISLTQNLKSRWASILAMLVCIIVIGTLSVAVSVVLYAMGSYRSSPSPLALVPQQFYWGSTNAAYFFVWFAICIAFFRWLRLLLPVVSRTRDSNDNYPSEIISTRSPAA